MSEATDVLRGYVSCTSKICMLRGKNDPKAFLELGYGANFCSPDYAKHFFSLTLPGNNYLYTRPKAN